MKECALLLSSSAIAPGMIGNHARTQKRIEEFLNTSELINKSEMFTRATIFLEDNNQHFMCEI